MSWAGIHLRALSLMRNQKHRLVIMRFKLFTLCLTIFMCSTATHAEYDVNDLKKLFTDERQRAQIDAARTGNNTGTETQQTATVSVTGYMKRSDGKNVVWVNGNSTIDSSRVGGVVVNTKSINKNDKVAVQIDGHTVYVRPGESWSKTSGTIKDNY